MEMEKNYKKEVSDHNLGGIVLSVDLLTYIVSISHLQKEAEEEKRKKSHKAYLDNINKAVLTEATTGQPSRAKLSSWVFKS